MPPTPHSEEALTIADEVLEILPPSPPPPIPALALIPTRPLTPLAPSAPVSDGGGKASEPLDAGGSVFA